MLLTLLKRKCLHVYFDDDIKPVGCTFNSASFVYETLVLFHIAQAICNRLVCVAGLKLSKP